MRQADNIIFFISMSFGRKLRYKTGNIFSEKDHQADANGVFAGSDFPPGSLFHQANGFAVAGGV